MEVIHGRCCGIDIHKKSVTACVIVADLGGRSHPGESRGYLSVYRPRTNNPST